MYYVSSTIASESIMINKRENTFCEMCWNHHRNWDLWIDALSFRYSMGWIWSHRSSSMNENDEILQSVDNGEFGIITKDFKE